MTNSKQKLSPEQWRNLLQQWQASQQSMAQFCREKEIPPGQFYYWRQRLTPNKKSSTFTTLKSRYQQTDNPSIAPMLDIKLINGTQIRGYSGIDAKELAVLLQALGV